MAENEKKQPMTKIGLQWKIFRPIGEQYRQQAVEFEPMSVFVQVDVPLTHEYVANSAGILTYQVSNESSRPDGAIEPFPILTLAGMRYVREQVEAVLNDVPISNPEEEWVDEIEERAAKAGDPDPSDDEDSPAETKADDEDDKNWEDEWE